MAKEDQQLLFDFEEAPPYAELQEPNDFVKPDEQSQTCLDSATAEDSTIMNDILPQDRQAETETPEEGKENAMLWKIEHWLRHCVVYQLPGRYALRSYVLKCFFLKGISIEQIHATLGEQGLQQVTKERIRMIVHAIAEEMRTPTLRPKYICCMRWDRSRGTLLTDYAAQAPGEVVTDPAMARNPRLNAIALMLNRKVVGGDTTLPWIKENPILLDYNIEKRSFNAHYQAVFYLLQKEVRPISMEQILQQLPATKHLEGMETDSALVSLILSHREVFETTVDGLFQLKHQFLNDTQQFARIIFEHKDLTTNEIAQIYRSLGGTGKSLCVNTASRHYSWCVPIGKSKWVYRPDGDRPSSPSEIIRLYCQEHVEFTSDDVNKHLASMGIHLNPASVRCYVMLHCLRKKDDKNLFRLETHIRPEEMSQWYQRRKQHVMERPPKPWVKEMEMQLCKILQEAPAHRLTKRKALANCMYIFEREGINKANFYKYLKSLPLIECGEDETGIAYIQLKETPEA